LIKLKSKFYFEISRLTLNGILTQQNGIPILLKFSNFFSLTTNEPEMNEIQKWFLSHTKENSQKKPEFIPSWKLILYATYEKFREFLNSEITEKEFQHGARRFAMSYGVAAKSAKKELNLLIERGVYLCFELVKEEKDMKYLKFLEGLKFFVSAVAPETD